MPLFADLLEAVWNREARHDDPELPAARKLPHPRNELDLLGEGARRWRGGRLIAATASRHHGPADRYASGAPARPPFTKTGLRQLSAWLGRADSREVVADRCEKRCGAGSADPPQRHDPRALLGDGRVLGH